MARTIGIANKNHIKKVTKEVMQKFPHGDIVEMVTDCLPVKLWDTWESADSEILRIILDTIFEVNNKK